MSDQPLFSFRNPWFSASVGVTAGIAVLAALAGMIWLPLAQPDLKLSGIWDAICSAAGVPRVSSQGTAIQPDFKTSNVVMTSEMLTRHDQVSIGRGATLAQLLLDQRQIVSNEIQIKHEEPLMYRKQGKKCTPRRRSGDGSGRAFCMEPRAV